MTGTFEGVGTLQFSPDNKHGYAYSGIVAVTNTEVTTLEFTTGSSYLVGIFQPQYFSDNNDVYLHTVKFNNVAVVGFEFNGSNNADGAIPRPIIIPPFTTVSCSAKNTTDSTSNNVGANIVGKIKGAIEQENLEAITDASDWASE
jgi:hypothetical protein